MRKKLHRTHSPDSFNVGVNVGHSAEQPTWHVHVHLEPRGGVSGKGGVLSSYREECAICRLSVVRLLVAGHIVP